ncbi:hypothetical protein ACL1G5_10295 [Corynebacterium striatum]
MAHIDSSDFSHVVTCELCSWRQVTTTAAAAWKHYAVHLKHAHGDSLAARRAADALRKRTKRVEKKTARDKRNSKNVRT